MDTMRIWPLPIEYPRFDDWFEQPDGEKAKAGFVFKEIRDI